MRRRACAHGHLCKVTRGHQAEAGRGAEALQHEAAHHRTEDAAEVHDHRQQPDGVGVRVGRLHAHQVGVHEQVAALAHEHQHREHPVDEHAVGIPAQQAQHTRRALREEQQVHGLHATRHARPQRQRAHHRYRDRRDVRADVERTRHAVAPLEEVRVEGDQDGVAHHRERRHRDDGWAQPPHDDHPSPDEYVVRSPKETRAGLGAARRTARHDAINRSLTPSPPRKHRPHAVRSPAAWSASRSGSTRHRSAHG
jgi:hypothetical protein